MGFKITGNGDDGVCADPQDVPECSNYYGDLEFQPEELVKAGVDPEAVGIRVSSQQSRAGSNSRNQNRVQNSFTELQLPADPIPEEPIKTILPARAQPPRFRNRPAAVQLPTQPPTTTTTTPAPAPIVTTTQAPLRVVDFEELDLE